MKKLLFAFVMLALSSSSAFAQRQLNERHAVVPNGFVRIFMLSGAVTVIGWDKDSLVVTGRVFETDGNRFGIGITAKGAKMGMWSELDEGKPSSIVVYVPRRSQVWVKTTTAGIRVRDVTGGLDLFSVSGVIEAGGSPRELYAESMGGSISLNTTTSTARIKSAAGDLSVNGAISDLTAVTVSGRIDVNGNNLTRARMESVDGDIRYTGNLASGSVIEMTNHAGAIEMRLPGTASADFSVQSYAGAFDVEGLNIGKKWSSPLKGRELTFALGGKPTARVTLRTFKGGIALRKL